MHYILPGSSIPEVYDDNYDLWTIFKKWTDEIRAKTIEKLALNAKLEKGTSGIFVCNPLPVNRSDLIEIPWKSQENIPEFVKISEDLIQPIQFISEDDPSLEPFEQKPARILFPAVLGSMEQKTYEFVDSAGDQPLKIVNVEESETDIVLENAWYILKIDKTNGSIVSLQIKQDANREPLSEPIETLAAPSNILEGFVDVMLSEPAWNISPTYRKTPLEPKTYRVSKVLTLLKLDQCDGVWQSP